MFNQMVTLNERAASQKPYPGTRSFSPNPKQSGRKKREIRKIENKMIPLKIQEEQNPLGFFYRQRKPPMLIYLSKMLNPMKTLNNQSKRQNLHTV
jgi:hypothetical protein